MTPIFPPLIIDPDLLSQTIDDMAPADPLPRLPDPLPLPRLGGPAFTSPWLGAYTVAVQPTVTAEYDKPIKVAGAVLTLEDGSKVYLQNATLTIHTPITEQGTIP